jgi:hypothetical protein
MEPWIWPMDGLLSRSYLLIGQVAGRQLSRIRTTCSHAVSVIPVPFTQVARLLAGGARAELTVS